MPGLMYALHFTALGSQKPSTVPVVIVKFSCKRHRKIAAPLMWRQKGVAV